MLELRGDRLVCPVCGINVPYRGKIYRHGCKSHCPYLGQPREETYTIKQTCKTCQGRKTSVLTLIVNDCAKQGRCIPAWRCNNALSEQELAGEPATACRQCEWNPLNMASKSG